MALNARSLQLTDSYRRRLVAISDQAEHQARQHWPKIQGLDATTWPEQTATTLSRAQAAGVRLTAGYVSAFIRSEVGAGRTPQIDASRFVGVSRDGRPLEEALQSPIIGVKVALKKGIGPEGSLDFGLARAVRTTRFEVMQSARDALLETVKDSPQIEGFVRAVAGTCAACMALSGSGAPHFEVHPGCECVPEPTVLPRFTSYETLDNADDPYSALMRGGENAGLDAYRGNSYIRINEYLRGIAEGADDAAERWIMDMDRLFARATTRKESLQLFRGLKGRLEDIFPELGDDLIGKVVNETGFSSSTPTESIAKGFGETGDVLELTVSPEVRALRMFDRSIHSIGLSRAEKVEVLLERDVDYRITGIRHEGGHRIVEIQVSRGQIAGA